jgi:hypothetical protein
MWEADERKVRLRDGMGEWKVKKNNEPGSKETILDNQCLECADEFSIRSFDCGGFQRCDFRTKGAWDE